MSYEECLKKYLTKNPAIDPTAYIAPESVLIGDVRIGPRVSIWPQCVLRGDINYIEIGECSNVQDGTVIHMAENIPVIIGRYVTIGHLAMLHACTVENECLIGMHSTILDGAVVGHNSIIGAHTLVTQGMLIPPGSTVLGVPGKIVRSLSEEEQGKLPQWAENYLEISAAYCSGSA